MKAKADSTGVDKRLRDAGMPISAGEYGNKKANETRASLKGQFTYSMDKDKATGKYKKITLILQQNKLIKKLTY